MYMKFPVKHTEDKSFYLSAKVFFEGEKKKILSSQCVVQLFASKVVSQDGVPLLCFYGELIVWCSTFSD